jgi:hypothetical protein
MRTWSLTLITLSDLVPGRWCRGHNVRLQSSILSGGFRTVKEVDWGTHILVLHHCLLFESVMLERISRGGVCRKFAHTVHV